MIKYLTEDNKYKVVIDKLNDKDLFFTRINVLYNTYGLNYNFFDIWYQSINGEYVSLISRLDNQFILFLTENSDTQEIEKFLLVLGFSNLLFDDKYSLYFENAVIYTGPIMRKTRVLQVNQMDNCKLIINSEYKDVYNFFNSCNSTDVSISDYGAFATDIHSKIRKNCSKIYSLYKNENFVSCAIITGDCHNKIISPIATLPEYRGNGFAKYLVNSIDEDELCLFCEYELEEFYDNIGFMTVGKWKEIHR